MPRSPPGLLISTSRTRPIHPLQHFPLRRQQFLSLRAPIVRSRPPRFATVDAAPPGETQSLESRVGSHWFNRIGILAILIGMTWFLKFAIDNHWIGPLGRVLIGLIAGAGLIAWSERFRARRYIGFSYSLKAVGSGILYLSLWAAFSLYHLVPVSVAFLAMIAVTAFNGYLAWVQDAELLALYAIVGGLSSPVLSRPAKTTKSRCSATC